MPKNIGLHEVFYVIKNLQIFTSEDQTPLLFSFIILRISDIHPHGLIMVTETLASTSVYT